MKVIFIRHAQSMYNVGTGHDNYNSPLSENGIISCKSLGYSFDLLIISPLKRAIQTYANSNIKTKNILISDLFQEVKNQKPNMLDDDLSRESHEEFEARIIKAIDYLKKLNYSNTKTIGVITHHDFIYHLTKKLIGKSISLQNLGIYEIII